jgi:4-hydroxyproline epimerase
VANVPSYRLATNVEVNVEGHGPVRGDVAWGGNWFFLVANHGQRVAYDNLDKLTDFTWRVREALQRHGVTGAGGKEIDHIELFAPSEIDGVDSKNFVLCPGKAYDRSPCGTGTSAKLVCLFADGKIKDGEVWRQESIVGSIFEGRVTQNGDKLMPSIKGTAHITAEADLILDDRDPFCFGIRQ